MNCLGQCRESVRLPMSIAALEGQWHRTEFVPLENGRTKRGFCRHKTRLSQDLCRIVCAVIDGSEMAQNGAQKLPLCATLLATNGIATLLLELVRPGSSTKPWRRCAEE